MLRRMLDEEYAVMPWERVDAVVFDVGNVLLRFSPEEILPRVLPDEPARWPQISERVFRSPYWAMLDRGTISDEEAAKAMAGGEKGLEEAVRRVVAGWRDIPAMAEGVAALRACKARGKRVYALTNYNGPAFAYIRGRQAFFRLLDGAVVSGEERLLKPDPAIYRLCARRFGLVPDRTLFIDDAPVNIEAAMDQGWQGLCYRRPGQLAAFFSDAEQQVQK